MDDVKNTGAGETGQEPAPTRSSRSRRASKSDEAPKEAEPTPSEARDEEPSARNDEPDKSVSDDSKTASAPQEANPADRMRFRRRRRF